MKPKSALDPYFLDRSAAPPSDLEEFVHADQQQCWEAGTARIVEEYVSRFPQLGEDHEVLLDLVYHEYLLRKGQDSNLGTDEFIIRFPDLARQFLQQVALHQAFDEAHQDQDQLDLIHHDHRLTNTIFENELPTIAERYRLETSLGAGGMGEVYSAWDTELERHVAIKLPKLDTNCGEQHKERIIREARALAKLNHPGICPIYDFGHHNSSCFIVMRLLHGITLSTYLQQPRTRSLSETVQIVKAIADAVATAHDSGIAHRDLKPSNIFLENSCSPVVIDFGLVRSISGTEVDLTESGVITGTPAYIAPERLTGKQNVNWMLADIYSLAVILYEMLTGKRPHNSKVTPSLLVQILTEPVEPPSKHASDIPPRLDEICMKALEKNPEKRYASMDAFAEALAEYVEPAPQPGDWDLKNQRAKKAGLVTRRWAGACLVVIAIALAIVGALKLRPTKMVMQEGERWVGAYQFKMDGEKGPVELRIEQLSDNSITGQYSTEGGEFVWTFDGQLVGSTLSLTLVDALTPAAKSVGVAGSASIAGTIVDDVWIATYKDDDSEASITLRRQTR
ncbi:MAG: serine/threonine-protein kinase [Pirellulaceae bacterium]